MTVALIDRICSILLASRLSFSTEKETQAEIAVALGSAGIAFEREKVIVGQRRIDFLCDGDIGIEVKLTGSPMTIHRQVSDYCGSGMISSIIIATARSIGFPREIAGKRCVVLPLGRGWL